MKMGPCPSPQKKQRVRLLAAAKPMQDMADDEEGVYCAEDGRVFVHSSEDHFRALGTSLQLVACDALVLACQPVREALLERREGEPKLKKLLQVSTRDSPSYTPACILAHSQRC